jgi:hypothetical protein
MAVSADIYSRFAPRQTSALDTFQQLTQIGGMQDQRQDNALTRAFGQQKLEGMRAQEGRMNALRQLQQRLGTMPEPEMIQGIRAGGFPEEAAAMEKDMLGRQKMAGDVAAQPVALAKDQGAVLTQALGTARTLWGQVQTPEQAQRLMQAQYADPVLSPILSKLGTLDQALSEMPTDPAQWAQWRDGQAMGIEAVQKMAMERDKANKPPAPPAAVAEYEYAKQQGYKGTLEQWVTSKAKAGAASTSVSYSQPVEAVDAQGNRVFIRTTKDGLEPAVIPGVRPPMSAAEERSASERGSRERQGRQMISGLEDARKILDAGRATQSGVGNVIDAAARLVGQTTVGAQDAARLEALSGWLVANVPRMEGPQSNFDVQNYTTMAGKIGDRTVPIAERKAALKEVERLQRKYAEINGTPMPPPAAPPSAGGPFTDAEKERRYQEWKRQQGAR